MFKPVSPKVDFPALEREILAWWQQTGMIQKYLHRNESSPKRYSFIDGPITANNPMGAHHAWGRTYKDLYQRYKTMQGFRQRYQNGFDGQGLWIEVEVERELGFNSKRDIEAYGIDRFVELCKERVRRFAAVQTDQSIRLGYWMDWDNSYHTMSDENNYTIWHFLKVCHQKGWIYEGTDVMPWCPRCGTGLSEHEIATEGYRELVHPGVFLRFPLAEGDGESLLVWTTTPWTLTSNAAAAVHPELTYVKVAQEGQVLYLAGALLPTLKGDYQVLGELSGKDLVGLRYRGPFDELPAQQGVEHRVVPWSEVSAHEGTGIVHIAPGCGREDFALGKEFDLPTIAPLDEFGVFVDDFDWLTGRSVYEVSEPILDNLRQKGILYRVEDYRHRYPVCWRCETELVFRLVDEWFISMGELRHLIAEVTRKIRWIPEFGLERELDWLRNMDDWMISKKRYWGLALPIYKCDCGQFEVIGSEDELKERAVEGWEEFAGHSPHRPWIDAVKILCPQCGEKLSRIKDVGNPWLDAGIVPFSTLDYRHDRDYWQQWFPADWISESFPGQFRNWFYSLLAQSTVLENQEPFRTVFSYALMRDEKGEEMHKSRGNAIWLEDAAERMGVDAMRWVFARTNPAANLNFGYGTADEARRRFIIPLWNVYSFFVTYANIDGFDPATAPRVEPSSELDRWIVSELNTLIQDVNTSLDQYDSAEAGRRIEDFVGLLSNWYVRRSRRRFWKSENDQDKLCAYTTLYTCLTTLARLLAPFMPFLTEEMYQNLVCSVDAAAPESVHLTDWPVASHEMVDEPLMEATRLAMRISSMGRAARQKAGIKVRQPVLKMDIKLPPGYDSGLLAHVVSRVMDEMVRDELNVATQQGVITTDNFSWYKYQVQPNHATLGPKYGSAVQQIADKLQKASEDLVNTIVQEIQAGRGFKVQQYALSPEDIVVTKEDKPGWVSVSDGEYSVRIDTQISQELADEGVARELVHRIQNLRRAAGFELTDRITTFYQGPEEVRRVMEGFGQYIKQETLSDDVVQAPPPEGSSSETLKLEGAEVVLAVKRL